MAPETAIDLQQEQLRRLQIEGAGSPQRILTVSAIEQAAERGTLAALSKAKGIPDRDALVALCIDLAHEMETVCDDHGEKYCSCAQPHGSCVPLAPEHRCAHCRAVDLARQADESGLR